MLNTFLAEGYVQVIREYVNKFGGANITETDIEVAKMVTVFFTFLR